MDQVYPQEWASHLQHYMNEAGASNVQSWRYPIDTAFAHKAWSDNQLVAFEEMSEALVPDAGGDVERFRELIGEVSREHPQGADVYYCPDVCVGQKL